MTHAALKGRSSTGVPTRISNDLRGREGPLFHGSAYIRAFFRKL